MPSKFQCRYPNHHRRWWFVAAGCPTGAQGIQLYAIYDCRSSKDLPSGMLGLYLCRWQKMADLNVIRLVHSQRGFAIFYWGGWRGRVVHWTQIASNLQVQPHKSRTPLYLFYKSEKEGWYGESTGSLRSKTCGTGPGIRTFPVWSQDFLFIRAYRSDSWIRAALETCTLAYLDAHFIDGVASVFATQGNPNRFTVQIVTNKYNPVNFWCVWRVETR